MCLSDYSQTRYPALEHAELGYLERDDERKVDPRHKACILIDNNDGN